MARTLSSPTFVIVVRMNFKMKMNLSLTMIAHCWIHKELKRGKKKGEKSYSIFKKKLKLKKLGVPLFSFETSN